MLREKRIRHYFEPFCGGAAVFFHLKPAKATLSDSNAELINCYVQIRDQPQKVIRALGRLQNSECVYYRVRNSCPRSVVGRAARVVYLTTLAFNGIYRVNRRGEFNVPYGYKTHLPVCDAEKIIFAAERLQNVDLLVRDFESVMAEAKRGDVLYLDPPYTVAHGNNGFIKYNERILLWEDQVRLAASTRAAADRGCIVIVSNADHPAVRKLYRGFQVHVIQRPSVMAASARFRRPITECLFCKGL